MDKGTIRRLQWFRQMCPDQFRVGLIGDDHIFAVDETVWPRGVAGAGRRHGRQLQDRFGAHRPAAVQPPSIGNMVPVMDLASSEARNTANAATCSTVTNSRVGWAC